MHSAPDTAAYTPAASTRDRSGRHTQSTRSNRILEAAIQLFARKGFQGTKTKEISEAAGINEALIFRDFHSKEKLYCAILEYASSRINAERWIEELSAYAAQQNDQALFSKLAVRYIQSWVRERNLYRLMLYSALEQHELARKFRERQIEPLERFIEMYVRSRQADGAFGSADPHAIARSFLNMCQHHVLRQVLYGDTGEWPGDEAAAEMFTRVFLEGIRSK
jgi:TetR/AcrR family transcriptional regulator